ncbi:hypothetical protein [Halosegnis marinus]|uniref:DUF4034 domain-containing protein n=1 Tax=Halosegnis marinus TaxID=3034023 RepID=A0ABD5ZK45_9EURY|nr:hypothetical protein [Halosegnis sp. DT85]
MTDTTPTRRRLLAATGGVAAVLAGCTDTTADPTDGLETETHTTTATDDPTATATPTVPGTARDALASARTDLRGAFRDLRGANLYDVENRRIPIDFESLDAFEPEPVIAAAESAAEAARTAKEAAPESTSVRGDANALLSGTVIARGAANLVPEVYLSYHGVWAGLRSWQQGNTPEALDYIDDVISTPERWEGPAEELHDGVLSLEATGSPDVDGFRPTRWERVDVLAREAPWEFNKLGLAEQGFTAGEAELEAGIRRFEEADWEGAASRFETAQPLYYRAYENAAALRNNDPYGFFRALYDPYFCRGSGNRRGSRYFEQAVRAYAEGDDEYGAEREQAARDEMMETAANCPRFPTSR